MTDQQNHRSTLGIYNQTLMIPWYKKRTHVHTVNTSFNRVFVISVTLLFKQLAFASCYFLVQRTNNSNIHILS